MKIIEKIKEQWEEFKNLLARGLYLLILVIIGLGIAGFQWVAIKTCLLIISFESLAIFLSMAAKYAFTGINFTKLTENMGEEDKKDWQWVLYCVKLIVLGMIFIGVHILAGLAVYSIYQMEYVSMTVLPPQ